MNTSQLRKNIICWLLLCFIVIISTFEKVEAQSLNYKSQSLYLYIFSQNITWPDTYSQGDFKIGVYGNSPIYDELRIMASLKKAGNGQKIVIRQIKALSEIADEHILYIASSKSRELKSITLLLADKPTLIVAERDGLAKKGAAINFIVMENNSLKFEVNTETLKNHNLKISSQLLARGFEVK